MFFTVYCASNVERGDALAFNAVTQLWEKTSVISDPFCIAKSDASQRIVNEQPETVFSTDAIFAGAAYAKASRAIPNQGGELQLEDNGVYVDNNADGHGLILPREIDNTQPREAGDLVRVWVR